MLMHAHGSKVDIPMCNCVCSRFGALHLCVAAGVSEACLALQRCAQEGAGDKPVTYASCYHDTKQRKVRDANGNSTTVTEKQWHLCAADKGGQQLFAWEAPFFWHPILAYIQFWVDAFTFDAKELAHKSDDVIKSRGNPQPPWQNKITDAGVGALPKFLVYLCVHWLLGVFAYFTATSCSGGRVGSFQNFRYWFHGLPAAYEQHCKDFFYYNHPEAYRKLPSNIKTAPFCSSNFRVCPFIQC